MTNARSTFIAIGGGDMTSDMLDEVFGFLKRRKDPRIVVLTVATRLVEGAYDKYNGIFRKQSVRHVEMIDVSIREDAFKPEAIEKLKNADAAFFTGGDQLNITSLFGGSPLHAMLEKRASQGMLVAGTSAGAAMMSGSMIIGGRGDETPKFEAVTLGPGLDLIDGTIIDTHFSQRGRHGRLLTAVAHYPQLIGIGIDESTAIVAHGGKFRVVGEGAVTVIDGSRMTHTDLVYRGCDEAIGLFGVNVHVLPRSYMFDLAIRAPIAPSK